jgi:hypothetical protein
MRSVGIALGGVRAYARVMPVCADDVRPGPRAIARLALGCALAAVLAIAPAAAKEPAPMRVLFVGNSYTYWHDVPAITVLVADALGVPMSAGMLAEPDYAIEDHFTTGAYRAKLEEARWDWVVLQQGPSSLPENREHLRVWTTRAADEARARGIRVALFSAWPALGNAHTWANAELSYHLAAQASGSCVMPVATAWRLARAADPSLPLYDPDGLHPSHTGTLLAALVFVRGLHGARPHKPGALDIATTYDDPEWRRATDRTAALDRHAARAFDAETQRCTP